VCRSLVLEECLLGFRAECENCMVSVDDFARITVAERYYAYRRRVVVSYRRARCWHACLEATF